MVVAAPPKTKAKSTVKKSFLSDMMFIITKKIIKLAITGILTARESYMFRESIEERRMISVKSPRGSINGLVRSTILRWKTEITAQSSKSTDAPMTRKICFGSENGSVVFVKKSKGNKNTTKDRIQSTAFLRMEIISLSFITLSNLTMFQYNVKDNFCFQQKLRSSCLVSLGIPVLKKRILWSFLRSSNYFLLPITHQLTMSQLNNVS